MRTVSLAIVLFFTSSELSAQQAQPSGVTQASVASASEIMARAQIEGQSAAQAPGTGGWFAGGFAGGLVLGLIGTAIVTWGIAGNSDVSVPADKKIAIANEPAV